MLVADSIFSLLAFYKDRNIYDCMNIILETTKRTSRIVDGHFSAKKQNFLEMYHKLGNFERNLAQKNDRIVGHDCILNSVGLLFLTGRCSRIFIDTF